MKSEKVTVAVLAIAGTISAFAGGFGTKYIAFGWDTGRATPAQILKMMPKFEKTPFDGVGIGCSVVEGDTEYNSGYIFNDPEWRFETFAPLIETYRAINSRGKLKENFLCGGLSARRTEQGRLAKLGGKNPRLALDDDAGWARVAHNYGVLAKVAKAGGFRCICLDNEDYHGTKQFMYDAKTDGDYDAAWKKMRQRGREVFGAMYRELPDLRLGLFWAMSNVRTQLGEQNPARAIRESGRLFPAFLNGLLDVIPPEAVVIDFDEDCYTFRAASGIYEKTYVQLMNDALIAIVPENRAKYRAQFRNSYLMYLDQYVGAKYRTRAGKRGVPNNWYRPPVDGSRDAGFRADLQAAVGAADEYVGIYGERFGFVNWGHELDGVMKPWNSFNSRVTWDEELGLGTKMRLARDPYRFLVDEVTRLRGDSGKRNLLANLPNFGKTRPGTFVVSEEVTNRNYFVVSYEHRGEDTEPVSRWQKGVQWNWEPGGTRKVPFFKGETDADGWTHCYQLLRVPVDATRVQLQLGTNEIRNAFMCRVDAPPRKPFQLAYQMDLGCIPAPSVDDLRKRVDALAALGYNQFHVIMQSFFAGFEDLAAYGGRKGVTLIPCLKSADTIKGEGRYFGIEGRHLAWNHVLDVTKLAAQRQREVMFWADAIFEYPELQREIGRNMIALVYGYTPGGDDRFDEKCAALAEHEVRFYLCPGTQCWKRKLSAAERLATAKANIDEAFAAARRYGAEGVMVCDWGDDGYAQPLEESLPALEFAATAAGELLK